MHRLRHHTNAMDILHFQSLSTQNKVADAVCYLNKCLEARHPRVLGQTPTEAGLTVGGLTPEINDDRILQCCLQWKQKCKFIIHVNGS